MPRKYKGLVWQEPPPKTPGRKGVWMDRLRPLVQHPGHWAMIIKMDTDRQASDAADNLSRRLVNIPLPGDDWTFAARGRDLYAIYHGKKGARARIRRTS